MKVEKRLLIKKGLGVGGNSSEWRGNEYCGIC